MSTPRQLAAVLAALAVAGACRIPPADPDVDPEIILETPQIVSYEVTCSPEEESWQVELFASHWSSGAVLSWTDGPWLERHTVRSVDAAPDGQGDQLRLRLEMILDPIYQTPGSSTVFRCPDVLTAQLDLYDLDDNRSDCVRWGPEPALLDGAVSSCDE